MNKNLPLYIYGSTIIFSGLFLLFSDNGIFEVIKFNMGIAFTAGAFFALITALSRQRKQVQFVYHELHAFAMLVYAIALLFFCNSICHAYIYNDYSCLYKFYLSANTLKK